MLTTSPRPSRKITFCILAALIGLSVFLRLQSVNKIMPLENYWHAYISHATLQGEKLYTDLIDNKPPAIYATYMIAELLWGYKTAAYVYCGLVFHITSLIFIFLILLRTHGKAAGLIGSGFWILASLMATMGMDFPDTEFYAATFMLVAIWAFIKHLDGEKHFLWVTGGAMAIATAYKTNAAFILLGFILTLLLSSFKKREKFHFPFKQLIPIVLPSLLLWGIIAFYFYAQNRFGDFWDVNFRLVQGYAGNIWLNEWNNLITGRLFYSPLIKNVLVLVVFSYVWQLMSLFEIFPKKYLSVYMPVFAGSILMTGSLSASCVYYYQQQVPLYCLMAAMLCIDLNVLIMTKNKFQKHWLASMVLLVVSVFYLGFYAKADMSKVAADFRGDTDQKLGQLLKSLTSPDETIYQWGLGLQYYFYSQRKAASGMMASHLLYFADLKLRERLYHKLVNDLAKSKPAFIIFNSWAFRLDQEPWMQPFWPEYRLLGLYGNCVIFEKRNRIKPAKEILAQLNLSTKPGDPPWENPHLELFQEWKNITLLDYERFYGKPVLPSGNGPEGVLVTKALELFRQKQHIKGRDLLAQVITINPSNLSAQAGMGIYNEATGQYYLAMDNFENVAKKIPHPFTEYYIESKNLLMQQAAVLAPPDK